MGRKEMEMWRKRAGMMKMRCKTMLWDDCDVSYRFFVGLSQTRGRKITIRKEQFTPWQSPLQIAKVGKW